MPLQSLVRLSAHHSRTSLVRTFTSTTSTLQVHPRGPYYDALMKGTTPSEFSDHAQVIDGRQVSSTTSPSLQSSPSRSTNTPQQSQPPAITQLSATDRELGPTERAKLVFASPLTGPQRLDSLKNQGTIKNGVLIPKKPEEPDNCCMSGCVNCVWDMYQEEMEEWQTAMKKANASAEPKKSKSAVGQIHVGPEAIAVDADQEARDKEKAEGEETERFKDELFEGVPVEIKQFMLTEKRLRKVKEKQDKLT